MMAALSGYELAQALGWTMIHSLWEGLAIATLVFSFSYRRPSEHRYGTQCVGLAALLAAGLVTFGLEMRGHSGALGPYEVSHHSPEHRSA